jgi:hypothetical protein
MTTTLNYGAITEIVDDRTFYSMIDSTGTEFTFEVYPLHITKDQINAVLTSLEMKNLWFIDYKISITEPTDEEILDVLNDGLLLKLSMSCFIIDNYGITHNVEFNKETESYTIKISNSLSFAKKNPDLTSLSDFLIDFVKESDNKKMALSSFGTGRKLYGKLFSKIKDLEDRVRLLEQK